MMEGISVQNKNKLEGTFKIGIRPQARDVRE
jgi:hypothetical protein